MVKYDFVGTDHYFSNIFDYFKKLENHINFSSFRVPGHDDFDLYFTSPQYCYYQLISWLDVLRSFSHILYISPI